MKLTNANSQYIYFKFSTCFGQLCAHHQENLLYLRDTGIFHSVWVAVWSAEQNMIITFTLICRLSVTLFKWTVQIIFHTYWPPSCLAVLLPIHVAREFSNKQHSDSIQGKDTP